MAVVMRPYEMADQRECLALFDGNCPEFFDPGERADYDLACLLGQDLVGAFGVCERAEGGIALRWILISPASQGQGVGSAMMARAQKVCREGGRGPLLDRVEMELDCL